MAIKMITTKFIEDEVFESSTQEGQTLRFDMRPQDLKKNMSPTQTLLAASAVCIAVDVVSILKKKRKTVNDLVIETSADRRESHPRGFTRIMNKFILYSTDTSKEDLYKVAKLALDKYCSVAATLSAEMEIEVEVKV